MIIECFYMDCKGNIKLHMLCYTPTPTGSQYLTATKSTFNICPIYTKPYIKLKKNNNN